MQIQNGHSRIENELNPAMSVRATHIAIMIRAVQIRRGNMSGITLLNESLGRRQDNVYQRIPHAPRRETHISWSEMDAISPENGAAIWLGNKLPATADRPNLKKM
jgi:hypothetical protein